MFCLALEDCVCWLNGSVSSYCEVEISEISFKLINLCIQKRMSELGHRAHQFGTVCAENRPMCVTWSCYYVEMWIASMNQTDPSKLCKATITFWNQIKLMFIISSMICWNTIPCLRTWVPAHQVLLIGVWFTAYPASWFLTCSGDSGQNPQDADVWGLFT